MNSVNIAEAKAHLSELVSQAAAGEPIRITRHGKAVAQLTPVDAPRRPISLAMLQALTATMPVQPESAGEFVRSMRDGDRY